MNISINNWPKRYEQSSQLWRVGSTTLIGLLYSNDITQSSNPELPASSTEKGLGKKSAMPYLVKSHFFFFSTISQANLVKLFENTNSGFQKVLPPQMLLQDNQKNTSDSGSESLFLLLILSLKLSKLKAFMIKHILSSWKIFLFWQMR